MGAWIAGLLADRIGRLPVQALCLYTQGTMAVALYVVQVHINFLEKKEKENDRITLIKISINEIFFFFSFFFIKIFNSRIDLRFNSSHSFNAENKRRLQVEYQINRESFLSSLAEREIFISELSHVFGSSWIARCLCPGSTKFDVYSFFGTVPCQGTDFRCVSYANCMGYWLDTSSCTQLHYTRLENIAISSFSSHRNNCTLHLVYIIVF